MKMSTALGTEDALWLERAVELGRRGWGRVRPNPMVGCVLVKGGTIVGEGWHEEYGGAHAEVNALVKAGSTSQGSTAFVSLEPCDHHGQTPPCSEGLIAAGVVRVVYGAADPGDRSGGGHGRLSAHGIDVVGPCFSAARARDENPAFFRAVAGRGVYLALKLAVFQNGIIAASAGERTRITGPQSADEVHRLRAGFDAILVGSGTAIVDDPRLTVRGVLNPRVVPARVVFDSRGRLPLQAALFSDRAPIIVVTSPAASPDWCASLRAAGAVVRVVAAAERGGVDLNEALNALSSEGISTVLCEGGARIATSLMEAERVQRFYLFKAPQSLGQGGVPAFEDVKYMKLWFHAADGDEPPQGWRLVETGAFGEDRLTVWSRTNA